MQLNMAYRKDKINTRTLFSQQNSETLIHSTNSVLNYHKIWYMKIARAYADAYDWLRLSGFLANILIIHWRSQMAQHFTTSYLKKRKKKRCKICLRCIIPRKWNKIIFATSTHPINVQYFQLLFSCSKNLQSKHLRCGFNVFKTNVVLPWIWQTKFMRWEILLMTNKLHIWLELLASIVCRWPKMLKSTSFLVEKFWIWKKKLTTFHLIFFSYCIYHFQFKNNKIIISDRNEYFQL